MANLNICQFIGNLTRDPEVKYTPKGTAIAAFGMAINRFYTTQDGEKREEVTFLDFEAYARTAELLGEYVHKGDPLYVQARAKLDQWDDKQTGQKRSKIKFVVESMQFLNRREKDGDYGNPSEGYQERPSTAPARRPPSMLPRPAADPDLDAAPDDIPF